MSASPIQYQINPINTFKTCIIGTMNIIDLALKNNAKILHALLVKFMETPSKSTK